MIARDEGRDRVVYAIADTHLGLRERPALRFLAPYVLGVFGIVLAVHLRGTSPWVLVFVLMLGFPYFALVAKWGGFPLPLLVLLLGVVVLFVLWAYDAKIAQLLEPYLPIVFPTLFLLTAGVHYVSATELRSTPGLRRRLTPRPPDWAVYSIVVIIATLLATGVIQAPTLLLFLLLIAAIVASPYASWSVTDASPTEQHRHPDFRKVRGGPDAWRVGARHSDSPQHVAEFLQWLIDLKKHGTEWKVDGIPVLPPTDLILLGDILELWDAENQNVLFSTLPIVNLLQQLQARKVYVLGNHDKILGTLDQAILPLGLGGGRLKVIQEVYPVDEQGGEVRRRRILARFLRWLRGVRPRIEPLPVGEREFIFLHGHRFGPTSHFLLSWLRQTGASLGDWPLVLFIPLSVWALHAWWETGSVLAPLIFAGSCLLWFPRYYMLAARNVWKGRGLRYTGPEKVVKGFRAWWGDQRIGGEMTEAGTIGVVFGHTHRCWVSEKENGLRRLPARLYNISSWVQVERYDAKSGKTRSEFSPTIFYADSNRQLILRWDTDLHEPVMAWDSRSPSAGEYWELPDQSSFDDS